MEATRWRLCYNTRRMKFAGGHSRGVSYWAGIGSGESLVVRHAVSVHGVVVNFAKRAKVPVHITRAGLGDCTCPPSGLAICYNALRVEKSIEWVQGSQHMYVPAKPNQSWKEKNEGGR